MKKPPDKSKSFLPLWHSDPATARQIKVLRFFGIDTDKPLTKGQCSTHISRLFRDPDNEALWTAYVNTTGDNDESTPDLLPHDREELKRLVHSEVVPENGARGLVMERAGLWG